MREKHKQINFHTLNILTEAMKSDEGLYYSNYDLLFKHLVYFCSFDMY